MNHLIRYILLLLLIGGLTACGFQLRGSNLESLKQYKVYVQSNESGFLVRDVREQLQFADIPLAKTSKEADYVISIQGENFEQKVLTVSSTTGKAEEYEIYYNAFMSITDKNGERLVDNEPISARRDFTFDEDAVLSKFDEGNQLHRDMSKSTASNVLRRLQAVTSQN